MKVKGVKNQGKNYASVTATFKVMLLKALIAVVFSCLRLFKALPAFFYFSFRPTCEGKNVQQEPKGIICLLIKVTATIPILPPVLCHKFSYQCVTDRDNDND